MKKVMIIILPFVVGTALVIFGFFQNPVSPQMNAIMPINELFRDSEISASQELVLWLKREGFKYFRLNEIKKAEEMSALSSMVGLPKERNEYLELSGD